MPSTLARAQALALAGLTLLLLAACGSQPAPQGSGEPPVGGGIPFPADRRVAVLLSSTQNGKDALQRSSGVTEIGDSLYLLPNTSGMEWAVYRFTPVQPITLSSAQAVFAAGTIDETWIGVADFSTQQWDFSGPYSATQAVLVDSAKHLSPVGNVYVAVVCAENHHAQIDTVSLSVDNGWVIANPNPLSPDDDGNATSLAVVHGNPAISFTDIISGELKYVRATDANGSAWGAPQVLDGDGTFGTAYTSLVVINGFPAISYYDSTDRDLKYMRASDVDGAAWAAPQTVESTGEVGSYDSLAEVAGQPAISYFDATNGGWRYVRASDSDPGTWDFPIGSNGGVGEHTSLAVVRGNPAISFYDYTNDDLKYVRASDAFGSFWDNLPVTVDSIGDVGQYTSLKVVNDNPAISYYDQTNSDLKYVRSSDAYGGAWDLPLTLDSVGIVGLYSSLAVVNGSPAVSYYDVTNGDLKYVRGSDLDGGTWYLPQILDPAGNVGIYSALAEVNGQPAVSYHNGDAGYLKYIRLN